MKGFKLSTHAAACFLLALSSTMILSSSAGLSGGGTGSSTDTNTNIMNQTCQQYPGEGYIGNPSDCTSWGYCKNNELIQVGTCGPNFRYDMQLGTCVYPESTTCINSVNETCKYTTYPTYIQDPSSCSAYAYCDGEGGYYDGYSCPTNQYFSQSLQKCTYTNTCPTGNICALVKNGVFVGDPNKCGNYIQCINGTQSESKPCANNLYFNKNTGTCGSVNPCSDYPANSTKCTEYTTDKVYISDGLTCYGYYYCSSTSGPGLWSKCPFATHFDESTQECVSPAAVKCLYNRCGNLNLQYVTTVNETVEADQACTEYSVCKNQQTFATYQPCPEGHQYFNEISQKCEDTVPAYPICKVE